MTERLPSGPIGERLLDMGGAEEIKYSGRTKTISSVVTHGGRLKMASVTLAGNGFDEPPDSKNQVVLGIASKIQPLDIMMVRVRSHYPWTQSTDRNSSEYRIPGAHGHHEKNLNSFLKNSQSEDERDMEASE